MPSRRASAGAISWRFSQPLPRLLAAAVPVVALITVVTTLPLRHLPGSDSQLLGWSLLSAVACSLFALVGILLLGPTLGYWRRRMGTGRALVLGLALAALSGSLLTMYVPWSMAAITVPHAMGWLWPLPNVGVTLGEFVTGVAATVVGIAASRRLSAGQVVAYLAGCIAGVVWGLQAAEPGFPDPYETVLWWTVWGLAAAFATTVTRHIRRP